MLALRNFSNVLIDCTNIPFSARSRNSVILECTSSEMQLVDSSELAMWNAFTQLAFEHKTVIGSA